MLKNEITGKGWSKNWNMFGTEGAPAKTNRNKAKKKEKKEEEEEEEGGGGKNKRPRKIREEKRKERKTPEAPPTPYANYRSALHPYSSRVTCELADIASARDFAPFQSNIFVLKLCVCIRKQ